ncbi:MAG: signal peptidase I [Hyphomicrobium sp.]|uniref:signal peptidase I n=1 Tax=Hyphomicrobium sp. TaxID=82 RepID=UPI003D118AD8
MEPNAQPSETLNPWTAIWWKPQAAIDAVVRREGRSYTLVLAALMGSATVIGGVALVPNLHWFAVVAFAILVGPLAGLIALYVDGVLLSWVGRALGGRASQSTLRTAIAWSALPSIAALLIVLGAIAISKQNFLRAYAAPDSVDDPVLFSVVLIAGLLPLWAIFLRIRTVGAVQRFGVVRATANVAASLLVILAVAAAIRTLLFQPFSVPSTSMEPAIRFGDNFYADKRSYGLSRYSFPLDAGFEGRFGAAAPLRGDIVVFKLPSDRKVDYIKRVIGLPGDEVLMKHGVLYINGTPVPKRPMGDVTVETGNGRAYTVPSFEETLPEGRKFVVLEVESDGPFDNVGPFKVEAGHYFVMGDNRDNSSDSRSIDQVGLVPADNIFARVSIVYFSAGELRDPTSPAHAFDNIRWDRMLVTPK